MRRLSRISTVWRKEFADTLRDRRTLIAMVVLPMVLYPVLMLGSLQALELQVNRLKQERYTIAVATPQVEHWLRTRIIGPDLARRVRVAGVAAEDLPQIAATRQAEGLAEPAGRRSAEKAAEADVRREPPAYRVQVFQNVEEAVATGRAHVGVLVEGGELPTPDSPHSVKLTLIVDEAEIRSQIAASGLEAILRRANDRFVERRLEQIGKTREFIEPLSVTQISVASPEKLGGSVLGQIIALTLVIMTITGAIYPAIDLTAGERERGTLETLMTAPVPPGDLIAGKFVVVTSIAMLSAVLNLSAIGATVYLGGLGEVLGRGNPVAVPIRVLPLVLVVLIPLAVLFSALLLAVCSFARSFKEAQNYVMPVMVVVLVPALLGVLPGTELEGPLLIMPVTNVVILTRKLLMGQIDQLAVMWVWLSTCLYAAAGVALAARLFGQEAVLFADSVSIRALLRRRFFRPSQAPSAAVALLLMAVAYSANFLIQQSLLRAGLRPGSTAHLAGLALTLVLLFAAVPIAVAGYTRVSIPSAFSLGLPRPAAWASAVCLGAGSWVLALAWVSIQERLLPLPLQMKEAAQPLEEQLKALPTVAALFFMGLAPALCEELFFRGFALSGLRRMLGDTGAVAAVAVAFGATHYSVHRLLPTAALGLVLGLLVVRFRSIWPAVLTHLMHNCIVVLATREDGLLPALRRWGFVDPRSGAVTPPWSWVLGAGIVVIAGIVMAGIYGRLRKGEADARACGVAVNA
jgi:sodium transport system permease protein